MANQILWKTISVIVFLIVCYQLRNLSNKVTFHQVKVEKSEVLESNVEIDFCYLLNIKGNKLSADHHFENDGKESKQKNLKNESNCNLNRPLSLNNKKFQNKNVSFIIQQFKKCKLENLIHLNTTETKNESMVVNYRLYSDYICLTHQFEIQTTNEKTNLEITPIDNNQTFLILLSFTRKFEYDGEFRSTKRLIYKRTCSKKNESNDINCTETNKKFAIEVFYTTITSLESPYTTDCIDRKSKTQQDCFEDCVKEKKKHISLSYSESDNFTLNFDELKKMRPILDQCTLDCNRPDCKSGSFAFHEIVETSNAKSFILLRINEEDHKYKAFAYYSNLKTSWLLITFFSLIFKINLYNQLAKLRNVYNNVELRNKPIKENKNLILIILVALIGFVLATGFEKLSFNFGKQTQDVIYKLESVRERSVSVSVCFALCDIIKNDSSITNCNEKTLMEKNLNEIDNLTWNENDFKQHVALRNSVKIVYLREMEILVFYRDFKKCFLVFYKAMNYYPQISLQRKSQIHFNFSKVIIRKFSYFLEDGFSYPKIQSKSDNKSFLHTIRITDSKGINCSNYNSKSCLSQDDCQQECILKSYFERENSLPLNVNLKMDKIDKLTEKDLKFSNNTKFSNELLVHCQSIFYKKSCISVRTTFRPKYNPPEPHHLSINLTPILYLEAPLNNEDKLIVLNRILSVMLILSGFSIRTVTKKLLLIFYFSKLSFIKYQYLKRFFNLIISLAFLIHFSLLSNNIVYTQMDTSTYKFYSNDVKIPVIRVCYEMSQNLNANNFTLNSLSETLKSGDVFEKVMILDKEYTFNETDKNSSVYIKFFYLDNKKCFNLLINEDLNSIKKGYFTLDESIKLVINLKEMPNRRYFLYINDKGLYDFDWYKHFYADKYYLFYFTHQQFIYQDDYYYFKNFFFFIKTLLGIEIKKNDQKSYSNHLKSVFNNQQSATTTSVPLYAKDRNLPIKNYQFQNYMQFRSLEGDKNAFDFTVNAKRNNFLTYYYKDQSYHLPDRSIISFIPNFTYSISIESNKYHLIEFFLHLFILFAFWYKISLLHFNKSIKKALPIVKFFIICFLFCILFCVITIFELFFKIVRFLQFRQV